MEIKFYIWSIEHNAWWKKNSWGYTTKIDEAETYSMAEAKFTCSCRNGILNSPTVEMVAENDLIRIKEKSSD